MIIWYITYFLAGFFCGGVFFFIFRKVVRPSVTRRFFRAFGYGIYEMFKGDESRFWHHYFSLIRQGLFFAGIQFIGVMLALCPIILMVAFVNGPAQSYFNRGARLALYPETAGEIRYPDEMEGGVVSPKNDPATVSPDTPFALLALKGGQALRIETPFAPHALCREDSLKAFVMEAFGFTVLSAIATDLIVLRPKRGYRNPFWPYLNDLDFLFIVGLCLSNLLLMFFQWQGKVAAKDSIYEMEFMDYMLTWIATSNIGLMKKAGQWESRLLQRRLDKTAIEKPIFVSGLARSGTTILLEILSGGRRTASHLYRDFPFIMTPVVWDLFTRVFSSRQEPMERPHKDRIKITRESPDAFEEPIWQYFYPHLHEMSSAHILHLEDRKPDFESFYVNHIRKILLLRKGERYLSKGNYNIMRLEYICSIFKDARFIVPVRHPLFHVDSLVRQHKLFVAYSNENQMVPKYLKAAGHYEFGPQRIPIILSKDDGAKVMKAWDEGLDAVGYAIQWAQVYRYILNLLKTENYNENIRIVRYEDLCKEPYEQISDILIYLNLSDSVDAESASKRITSNNQQLSLSRSEVDLCWNEVASIAKLYGYEIEIDQTKPFNQNVFFRIFE